MPTFNFNRPAELPRATFTRLYSRLSLEQSALQLYTKSLFSWRKALSRSLDEKTLYDFARNTPRNLNRLHQMLQRKQFSFREARKLEYRFHRRSRTLYIFPWEERIVDLLLYRALNRYFDREFSNNSYAYRFRGFGVNRCQRRIYRALVAERGPLFFAKRDIADYFPSIDHQILLQMLSEWVEPTDYLFQLLKERVDFRYLDNHTVQTATHGVPFGTALACFFANLYLTPLDREIATFTDVRYYRYADDLLLFSRDADALVAACARMDQVFDALRLASKPSHHHDFSFRAEACKHAERFHAAQSFRHLGLEYRRAGDVGLSREKLQKIRNLFRRAFLRTRRRLAHEETPAARAGILVQAARQTVERTIRAVAIIDYYLQHVDDESQLKAFDQWLAEEVLSYTFRNGHKKGNFRRLSFGELRRAGLPSLLHRHRLLKHGHLDGSFFSLRTRWITDDRKRRLSGRRAYSSRLEASA